MLRWLLLARLLAARMVPGPGPVGRSDSGCFRDGEQRQLEREVLSGGVCDLLTRDIPGVRS